MSHQENTPRRDFITKVVGGAAALGLSTVLAPLNVQAEEKKEPVSPLFAETESWIKQLKGKHKMVFDWPKVNNGAALGWALNLMDTYNDMGIEDKDLSIVIVMRYATTAIAVGDPLWAKYGFGKRIDLKDPETNEFAVKNLFAKCATEDDDCLELFQKRGGIVCVCHHAFQGASDGLAEQLKLNKEDLRKEFLDNLLPGIRFVPTGIWAVNRLQEAGCKFCFGG